MQAFNAFNGYSLFDCCNAALIFEHVPRRERQIIPICFVIKSLCRITVYTGINLIKVDKSENIMYLLDNCKIVKEYHVAFGENP
jgi:hypothetical protein